MAAVVVPSTWLFKLVRTSFNVCFKRGQDLRAYTHYEL